ncbi:MAG: hypothetical protein HY739_01955 [Desulfobacterales bacterium]|nr:hypothetical protein [Desulfobacterales bacterium]
MILVESNSYILTLPGYSAQVSHGSWVTLRSDVREEVKEIIRSEVDKREGFSTPQEGKANLSAVEDEKEKEDAAYKRTIDVAGKEFTRAKKRRDDLTTQFQAASTDMEEQQKNIKTIRTGIENLDSQIARYNQDVKTQQDTLKKWLQTEKQGEALVAAIFTRGFKDKAHALESLSDQASAPLMAAYMGVYIQSFTQVIGSALSVDFIRAIEEGTAKWNNEEPLRIELEKGAKGTAYLRLKRYELYPFQDPKGGRVKPAPSSKNIRVALITTRKELEDFITGNGYSPANYDLNRAYATLKETVQMNAATESGLQEQVRLFQERIGSLKQKVASARSEKEAQLPFLKKKEEQGRKTAQETTVLQSRKEEAELSFHETQKSLHNIRRIRESIIVKTALATARGSQSPAESSAEAIVDKLSEVKNDAKTQHSTSTTEVTNFQITAESSTQAITEAHITAVRLISFINEGDSVRVKIAFRVRTVLEEPGEEVRRGIPPPFREAPAEPQPSREVPAKKKVSRLIPLFIKPADGEERKTAGTPEPEKAVPVRERVSRNPNVLGDAEAGDVLFEVISARSSGDDISVFVDVTNITEDSTRNVAIYDEAYRWVKSKMIDDAGKEHEVSQVLFWKGQQKTSMYDAGTRGVQVDGRTTFTAQLIFKKVPSNLKTINKLTIHPFIYFRKAFIWTWKEYSLPFQNIRVSR